MSINLSGWLFVGFVKSFIWHINNKKISKKICHNKDTS